MISSVVTADTDENDNRLIPKLHSKTFAKKDTAISTYKRAMVLMRYCYHKNAQQADCKDVLKILKRI